MISDTPAPETWVMLPSSVAVERVTLAFTPSTSVNTSVKAVAGTPGLETDCVENRGQES